MTRCVLMLSVGLVLAACGGDESGLPAVGTLERDRIEVVAEAHEILLELPAHEGQHVRAGELLASQDDARLRIAVARAEAARTRASRRMDELVRGPRREEIAEAQARQRGELSAELDPELMLISLLSSAVFPFLLRPMVEKIFGFEVYVAFSQRWSDHATRLFYEGARP